MIQFFKLLWDLFRHLNETAKWNALIEHVGHGNIYVILFAIIFAETGLVVTPFLPGDSLLFAIGAIGARHEIDLNLPLITVLLVIAAVAGDAVNYWIGYKMGPAVFKREDSKLLNKKHLLRAQEFYEKYGGKTIILARFVPIVRTFAPFVAGVGKMNFFRFWMFNIVGGIAWVLICILGGVFFGGFEFVQKHFELVIVAIVIISILPMGIEYIRAKRVSTNSPREPASAVRDDGA
jgi:membrane-associated protein